MADFLQFLFSGLTVGAVYALVALGFTLIYNASGIINFAQGEFVMLGGMSTVFLALAGVPLPLAALLAVAGTVLVGLALHRFAIEPTRGADAVTLIMITIGASIFLRGAAQVVFDKRFHSLPHMLGTEPVRLGLELLPLLARDVVADQLAQQLAHRLRFPLGQLGEIGLEGRVEANGHHLDLRLRGDRRHWGPPDVLHDVIYYEIRWGLQRGPLRSDWSH